MCRKHNRVFDHNASVNELFFKDLLYINKRIMVFVCDTVTGGIRKATPAILLSLALMVAAEVLSIVGYLRNDVKTLAGGVLFIVSGDDTAQRRLL